MITSLLSLSPRHALVPAAALAALLAGAACGGSSGSNTGGGTGTGGQVSSSSSSSSGSTSSSSGSGGQAPTCPGAGYSGGEMTAQGGTVTATVLDQNGAPVGSQPIYICGIDICSDPATTNAAGLANITTNKSMMKPAFKFGDALTYSELAIPLSMATTTFATVATVKLPATGVDFKAGMDATSAGVTIAVPSTGATVNELVYDTPDKQQFRAGVLKLTGTSPVIDPGQLASMPTGAEVLFGVSPAGTLLCPAAKVTVPNAASWAAGTAVEFWVMTTDTGQEYAPYAGWAKASDGAVSADGQTVSTADGGGFIYLDNFVVRKKP